MQFTSSVHYHNIPWQPAGCYVRAPLNSWNPKNKPTVLTNHSEHIFLWMDHFISNTYTYIGGRGKVASSPASVCFFRHVK